MRGRDAAVAMGFSDFLPRPSSEPELAASSYQLLGMDDEVDVCELCGKRDLKATMVLSALDADGDEVAVVRYGRDCGARALGWKVSADRAEKIARGTARFTYDQLYDLLDPAMGRTARPGSDAVASGPNRATGTVDGVQIEVEVARPKRAQTLLAEGWTRAFAFGLKNSAVLWRLAPSR